VTEWVSQNSEQRVEREFKKYTGAMSCLWAYTQARGATCGMTMK